MALLRFEYPTLKVFAAAVLAFRTNNGYYKTDMLYNENNERLEKAIPRNTELMRMFLTAESDPCTAEDYAEARTIIEYYQGKLIDLMSGKLNTYSQAACNAANLETVTEIQTIGLIASLPKAYKQSLEFDRVLETKERALANSSIFGSVGEVYSGTIEIVASVYSQKWFRHFITAKDITTGNVINFSSNRGFDTGVHLDIKGKIKDHVDRHVTRLNYVKISVDATN